MLPRDRPNKERLGKDAVLGRAYDAMLKMEAWADFKERITQRINLTDERRDRLTKDEQFGEWRKANHQIEILREFMAQPNLVIKQGKEAEKLLKRLDHGQRT